MNLVDELQVSATKDDVLVVLRNTRRLASKLKRPDIIGWLQAEQDGYKDGQTVPNYRRVGATLAYNSNGYIPAGYGRLQNGIEDLASLGLDLQIPMRESISVILTLVDRIAQGEKCYYPIAAGSEEDRAIRKLVQFHPQYEQQITLLEHLNGSQIRAIPEHIKNKVLEWACELETAGVTGEGMTFSPKEVERAHSITFNLTGCNIDQLNNMGTNNRGTQ